MANPFKAGSATVTGTGTSRAVTITAATAAGDTLLVLIGINNITTTVSAVTDSKSNVYTLDRSLTTANPATYAYRSPGATGGSGGGQTAALTTSDTVTVTTAAVSGSVDIFVTCVPGAGALDQLATLASGTSTTPSVSATPTADNETCVSGHISALAGGAPTVNAPFTDLVVQHGAAAYNDMGYDVLGAGTSGVAVTSTETIVSSAWRSVMWTFFAGGTSPHAGAAPVTASAVAPVVAETASAGASAATAASVAPAASVTANAGAAASQAAAPNATVSTANATSASAAAAAATATASPPVISETVRAGAAAATAQATAASTSVNANARVASAQAAATAPAPAAAANAVAAAGLASVTAPRPAITAQPPASSALAAGVAARPAESVNAASAAALAVAPGATIPSAVKVDVTIEPGPLKNCGIDAGNLATGKQAGILAADGKAAGATTLRGRVLVGATSRDGKEAAGMKDDGKAAGSLALTLTTGPMTSSRGR